MRTGWVSRLVDNPLGHFIRNHAQASGMDLSEVVWVPYDGSGRADRIGLNFTEVGMGVRASVTLYDRGHTAVAHMKPGDVDWKRIFLGTGRPLVPYRRHLHGAERFAARTSHWKRCKPPTTPGPIVSYDLNFRSKLWSSQTAIEVTKRLRSVHRCSHRERGGLHRRCSGFAVEGTDEHLKRSPSRRTRAMVEQVVAGIPPPPGGRHHAPRGGERTREQLVGDHVLRRDLLPLPAV